MTKKDNYKSRSQGSDPSLGRRLFDACIPGRDESDMRRGVKTLLVACASSVATYFGMDKGITDGVLSAVSSLL